jgi:hypothetical protein
MPPVLLQWRNLAAACPAGGLHSLLLLLATLLHWYPWFV